MLFRGADMLKGPCMPSSKNRHVVKVQFLALRSFVHWSKRRERSKKQRYMWALEAISPRDSSAVLAVCPLAQGLERLCPASPGTPRVRCRCCSCPYCCFGVSVFVFCRLAGPGGWCCLSLLFCRGLVRWCRRRVLLPFVMIQEGQTIRKITHQQAHCC